LRMVDFVKMVRKHDPGGIAADESILAVTAVKPRRYFARGTGGSAGIVGVVGVVASVAGDAIREAAAKRAENAAGEPVGDAATWPPLEDLALVLTGRRVVLYDGGKGLRKLRGPVSEYSLERIASIAFDKGKMWNVVRIAFADGSVHELDSAKGQQLGAFVEAFVEALGRAKAG